MSEPLLSPDAPADGAAPARAPNALPAPQDAARHAPLPWLHYMLAASCGALNTLSFAPVPHGGWFELVVFGALFWLLTQTRSRGGAALTGGAFGFGNFVTGVWWLYVSMHHYGGMAPLLAGSAVVLFTLYLALYPALAGLLWHICAARAQADWQPTWRGSLVFACAWALTEWLRGLVFTGFPWLASGYPQVDGPLSAMAPLGGVYAVGWLLALVAALAVQGLLAARRAPRAGAGAAPPQRAARATPLWLAIALLAMSLAGAGHHWTTPIQTPLTVRLLQGNIPQNMKFEQAGFDRAVALYQQLITARPADLIVTPETAIPTLIQELPREFGQTVRDFSDRTGSYILFGAIGATLTEEGPSAFTNSLFGVTPGEHSIYRYDKHHLVPFGEFVPYGFHWFVNLLKIPMGDQSVGPPVQPSFAVRGHAVAVDICYEDIFGEAIARTLREQAQPASILVNSTNLGWFGDTVALDQHLQMARMRTLETGRPLLSASNTGVTAALGADGTILGRLPPFTVGSLDLSIVGTSGRTPYVSFGDLPVVLGSLLVLGIALLWRRSRRSML